MFCWIFACFQGFHDDVLAAGELQKLQEQLAGHPVAGWKQLLVSCGSTLGQYVD